MQVNGVVEELCCMWIQKYSIQFNTVRKSDLDIKTCSVNAALMWFDFKHGIVVGPRQADLSIS